MKRSWVISIALILILVSLGWIAFRWLNPDLPVESDENFRNWLWYHRNFDMVVQVLLMFSGALGISALLPVEDKDE
jgi:multisubunit Na+/H+ antiporter MnhB subunit